MDERSYWGRLSRRTLSRRSAIISAATSGGLIALACSSNGRGGQAPAGGSQTAGQTSETPKPGGTFTTSNRDNAPTLDVHRTTSGYIKAPTSAMLSRLLRYKTGTDFKVSENHLVEPDLAVSAESPDAITWTVKLRPDAKFHNIPPVSGHAVEAEDIKATIDRANDPKNPARSGLDMIDPSQVQTPDKMTVVFKLKYPYAPFSSALASPNYFFIFPREAQAGGSDN
jgi:ABC-type transport system substrate-binding protein